jgi:hypothetical protein
MTQTLPVKASQPKNGKLPRFTMRFEPMTIEHLGLRLYSALPPVIAELVSNAFDAEAKKVEITLPKGPITAGSEVVVRDYGHGMGPEAIQDEFLPIGRNRRGSDSANVMSKNNKVKVTGRKGLGKLSAFGIATELEVRAYSGGQAVTIRLNYDDMQRWVHEKPSEDYQPTVVPEKCGPTNEPDGAEIRLRKLHRSYAISEDLVRKGIARRLRMIGSAFKVLVNGQSVKPGDRLSKSACPEGFSWDIGEIPDGGHVANGAEVTGWIGFLEKSAQTDRGIDIFASGKAVELGSFFNLSSTHAQFARAHLVGEVHADFLDGDADLAATARNSVVWESDLGAALEKWGQAALKWALDRWVERRRENKKQEVVTVAAFDKWLVTRPKREQDVANKMVKLLVDDPDVETATAVSLLELVKSSVETVAFRELVEAIEGEGVNVGTLLRLFDEWRVIEAREHLKLADGRTAAIEKLERYMRTDALEVQKMQPLFEKNLWLLDPSWNEADGQTTYTQQLRKHCKEPKGTLDDDRRIDILGVRAAGDVCVVEIKRPSKTLSRKDLEQLASYVDWARGEFIGDGAGMPKYVRGLLVVGKLSSSASVKALMQRNAGADMRVETYDSLRVQAKEYYGQAEKALSKIAPEYVRKKKGVASRKQGAGRKAKGKR